MARTQETREVAIETPLGPDVLLLRSMDGREEMGRLFSYELELLSEDGQIEFNDLLGRNVTVRVETTARETRYFNGFIVRFMQVGTLGRLVRYRAVMVPWAWFLTRTSDCRIFQNMTVPDIIEQVFRAHGFSDFKRNLSGSYRTWEYCVQYRESGFSFISRLMEQEGIYFFFEHTNGKHELVLADEASSHEAAPGYETIPFVEQGDAVADQEYIHAWVNERAVCTGAYALNDFDFTAPAKSLLAEAAIERAHQGPPLEWFDYPGEYTDFADAETYARLRIEELQASHELAEGKSNARGIAPGCTFKLADFPRADQCREYLVVAATWHVESDAYDGSGQATGRGPLFECGFTAMGAEEAFRTARITPKPMIRGPQTAMVVGPAGEEVHTDEYGRVKVQFHWDRYGIADENSSCWIRVAQVWAGKKWGGMYIPRVGQEVIVEFLEGDPDRPIITGRVYNGGAMPPYDLPANKTMSTLKSNSSKGGEGFNEIRFEDKKGSEQLFINAQRNEEIQVGNDCFENIGNNRHLVVKTDQFEHVEHNRSEIVDADHTEKIGKDRHLIVKGKEAKKVDGSHSFTVTGDVIEAFKKNHNETVTKDYYLKADNIVIEGLTNITINVGNSYIAIDKSGIKIATNGDIEFDAKKGITGKALKDIAMKATANLKLEATAKASMKGTAGAKVESPAMTEVASSAMVKVQGALVKIN